MTKFKLANGWTKESVMNQIKKYNNGHLSCVVTRDGYRLCKYETKAGNRCAIGCFIPDNHKGLNLAGGVSSLIDTYPELMQYMPFDDIEALIAFQNEHDGSYNNYIYLNIQKFLNERVGG